MYNQILKHKTLNIRNTMSSLVQELDENREERELANLIRKMYQPNKVYDLREKLEAIFKE